MSSEEAPRKHTKVNATPQRRTIPDLFAELDEQARDKVEATIRRDVWESIKAKILPGLEPREVK
jgi:hypothetical protein